MKVTSTSEGIVYEREHWYERFALFVSPEYAAQLHLPPGFVLAWRYPYPGTLVSLYTIRPVVPLIKTYVFFRTTYWDLARFFHRLGWLKVGEGEASHWFWPIHFIYKSK